jgi:deoxyribose-phosphate aldolase
MDDVADRIEHTVLGPTTTLDAVLETLDVTIQYGMRACVPPCYLEQAVSYAPGVEVVTVVGFPHGQHTAGTKCHEATSAWKAGAAEVDVVANVGEIKSGEIDAVRDEVAEVVASVPIPVKVIVEAPLLSEQELRDASEAVADAGADYVKTATGFSEGGATVADVSVMSEYCQVKASGGVGSWAFAEELFEAGADRIGASSGDVIVREYREETGGSEPDRSR